MRRFPFAFSSVTALTRLGACGCRYFCPVAALLPAPLGLQTVEQYVQWIRTASLTVHDKRIAAMNGILKRYAEAAEA